jgi:hypothetical protein
MAHALVRAFAREMCRVRWICQLVRISATSEKVCLVIMLFLKDFKAVMNAYRLSFTLSDQPIHVGM